MNHAWGLSILIMRGLDPRIFFGGKEEDPRVKREDDEQAAATLMSGVDFLASLWAAGATGARPVS